MTLNVSCLRENEDFTRLEPEWDLLLRQSPVDDAFLTWEWLHTWWKHYGQRYQLFLLVAREDGRLVGAAPLMLQTEKILGLKIRVLRNIGIAPDASGIIIQNGREDVLTKIALWLRDNRSLWDVLMIGEIPPGGINVDAWTAGFTGSLFRAQVYTTRHFYLPIDGDWDRYNQRLSKKLRKDVRRNMRNLQNGPGLQYCHKLDREADSQDIETVFRVNQKARHVYLYRDDREREFHQDLAAAMARKGWLDIHFLFVGNHPVAFRYGFRYNQVYEDWRTGFDEAYPSFSLGKVLLYLLIQDGFEHGLKCLDFMQGDEDYKLNWKVETRLYSHMRIVRNAPVPMLVYYYYPRLKRSLRDLLSRHEMLHPMLKGYERLVNFTQNTKLFPQGH